jgi:internalin A
MDRQAVLQRIEQAASEQASVLNLSGLGLTEVPLEIGQLVNLKELDLSGNQISIIPDEIGQLVNLEHLDLRHNQIVAIPEAIGQLVSLRILYLTGNQISVVPKVIGRLVNLQRLALRNNQISVIPEVIGQLVNLQRLSFGRNQICVVPEVIGQLVNLKILILKENPGIDIPPEIIRKGWGEDEAENGNPQAIFAYLKAYRQSAAKRPLNELKVLLVGEGAVGKTSLLKRLTDQPFDAAESKTSGINIKSWRVNQGDQSIRYNYWDFGGQKVMHSTH